MTKESNTITISDAFFNDGFKRNLITTVITNSVIFIIFIVFLFFIFYNFYLNFQKDYKLKIVSNFTHEVTTINDVVKDPDRRIMKFKEVLMNYLKDNYINSIWFCNNRGDLILHSNESLLNKSPNFKKSKEYNFIFIHNWSFHPDGSAISVIKEKSNQDYTRALFPIYGKEKKLHYIIEINFKRFLSKFIYIPFFKSYINSFYLIIGCVGLLLLILLSLLLIVLFNIGHKEQEIVQQEFMNQVVSFDIEKLPFQFTYNKEKFKNNSYSRLLDFLNSLFDNIYLKLTMKRDKNETINKIVAPAIFEAAPIHEKVEVIRTTDKINLKEFLWGFYSKENMISRIPGYSSEIYHYHKENDSDLVYRFLDISPNRKGFFIAKTLEKDVNKKILYISLLNYIFTNIDENISNVEKYLAFLNSALYSIHPGSIRLHACYMILNTETNYIEIASSGFSPLMHYKSELNTIEFYEYPSVELSVNLSDDFLSELKKTAFQLSPGDMILIPNQIIEKIQNYSDEKLEVHKIADIIKDNKSNNAQVLMDKIKKQIKTFSGDKSRLIDLFMLLIKREKNV